MHAMLLDFNINCCSVISKLVCFRHSSKSDTNSEKTGSSKKKKKRRKESKHRKKKKEKRKHYCSSPSYSDYEPDNPLLKNKRRYEIYWGFTPVKPSNILWHILCYFGYWLTIFCHTQVLQGSDDQSPLW